MVNWKGLFKLDVIKCWANKPRAKVRGWALRPTPKGGRGKGNGGKGSEVIGKQSKQVTPAPAEAGNQLNSQFF